MKRKNTFFVDKENGLKDVKAKHNYQITEEYWKKKKNVKKIFLNSAKKYHEFYYFHFSSFCNVGSSSPMGS